MVNSFVPLASRDAKEVLAIIEKQWGCKPNLATWAIFRNSKDNLYLASRDMGRVDFESLRVSSIGCYIGELKHGQLRVSIEGSQFIGPLATKNIADISLTEAEEWMKGQDLDKKGDWDDGGFIIVRHGKDYLGSGKYRDGRITNFVPKNRRLTDIATTHEEETDEHVAEA